VLVSIWGAIVGAFEAAAKAVGDAVDWLWNWIVEKITRGFEIAIETIRTLLNTLH